MSLAICIKCGSRKISAWSPCEVCGHRSVDLEDLARSRYLSDDCRPPKELKDASRQIKEGNFTFQEQPLSRLITELREQPALVERARAFRPFRLHPLLRILVATVLITLLIRWFLT